MATFPFDEYLVDNTRPNLANKTVNEVPVLSRQPMSPALEWALRHKHAEANGIISNLPNNITPGGAGNTGGINLRRTANDIKKKDKKEAEIDPGFLIRYLPFLLILAVLLYFFFMMDTSSKTTKGFEGIYKPNEALLYARNISCEVQPH